MTEVIATLYRHKLKSDNFWKLSDFIMKSKGDEQGRSLLVLKLSKKLLPSTP